MKFHRYKKSLKVGTILQDLIDGIIDRKRNPLLRIEFVWNEVLPETISRNCQPARFRKGVLTVKCTNSLWKTELLFYKYQIIERINSKLKEDLIFDIVFK